MNFKTFLREVVQIVIIAVVIVIPIRYFIFQPFIVSGESMLPTFHNGDYLISSEISYMFSEPRRGDVIIFAFPLQTREKFIKRIIGLPGETLSFADGQVEIIDDKNTLILQENYLPDSTKTYLSDVIAPGFENINGAEEITLGEGEYFVMGDNREFSYDSRSWGTVPEENIIGRVFFKIFPIWSFSQITRPAY